MAVVRPCARRQRCRGPLGIAGRGRGHALRRLRLHCRGGAGTGAGRAESRSQCRQPARAHRLVGRRRQAVALVRGLRRAGYRLVPAGDTFMRARRSRAGEAGAVALARCGLLHDAGDDVRLPRVHRPAGRHDARCRAAAALGFLGAHAAGDAVLVRPVLPQRAGATCACAASAWTCRLRSASRSLSRSARRPPSIPPGRGPTRSTSIRSRCSCSSCSRAAGWRRACATAPPARSRR